MSSSCRSNRLLARGALVRHGWERLRGLARCLRDFRPHSCAGRAASGFNPERPASRAVRSTYARPVSAARILVLGAQGVLGSFCARALSAAGFDVIRAGRRLEASPDFRLVDVREADKVADACSDADLVLQTVPDPAFVAERAVLERGGRMLGVASLPLAQSSSLLADARGGCGEVVIDAGLNPGVTTLLLADMLARHPEADEIEFGYTNRLSPRTSGGRAGFSFFFGQLAAERRRPTAVIPFPEPFGRRRCLEFSRGEEGWLGTFALDHEVREYIYFAPAAGNAVLLALNRLGFLGLLDSPLLRVGRRWVPRGLSMEPKCDWVALKRDGDLLEAWTVEGNGDYRMTVASVLAFVEAMVARPLEPGVRRAQEAFSLADIGRACEDREIRFAGQPI